MSITALPPVGWHTLWKPRPLLPGRWLGHRTYWLDSGTSALIVAFAAARAAAGPANCDVIVGAYGCPDVVAAATRAGCRVWIVDTLADSHRMDPVQVAQVAGRYPKSVFAPVALNFLGIAEDSSGVEQAVTAGSGRRPMLITDWAQSFPARGADLGAELMIASFGRGKPISLQGGGVLLVRETSALSSQVDSVMRGVQGTMARASRLRMATMNLALHPVVFGTLSRIPMLDIGSTRLRRASEPRRMDEARLRLIEANVAAYERDSGRQVAEVQHALAPLLSTPGWKTPVGLTERQQLLRFPVLAPDQTARDALLAALNAKGLGVSPMYAKVLPDISGVAEVARSEGSLRNSRSFASRLLTVPTHRGVTAGWIGRLARAVNDFLQ